MADPTDRMTDAGRSNGSVVPAADEARAPEEAAAEAADLGRRRFFRQFAGDLANTAATMMGAAQALQRTSAELAGAILDPARAALEAAETDAAAAAATADEAGPGFRTAFRFDGTAIRFVDQRALPGAVTEHTSRSAAEVTWAIKNDVVLGGPAIGQAAGLGLAMTAGKVRGSRPYARRATLRGAAHALTNASPTHAAVGAAVRRVKAAYEAVGELNEDGDAIADAMLAAAERVVADATDDHGRLVEAGLAVIDGLPRPANGGPLRLLVHGPSGTLAGGQAGTALAIAIAAHHAEREVRVIVPEARPGLAGARVTCWELAAAGVPHLLVADAAGPSLIASGEVDVVVVPADRVTANGDVAATIGTYPLAVVAARHGVPFIVVAPTSSIDPETATGADVVIGMRPPGELDRVGDALVTPRGTESRVPLHDVTPAELITTWLTADGPRTPPFGLSPAAETPIETPTDTPAEGPA